MPDSDLPPLSLLPAFDAVGRHGSFKAAARELHVTPSAISQQIKALEESLGAALFERRPRLVTLTSEGQLYLQEVQQVLSDLASASRRVRRRAPSNILRINTTAFVASEFLVPRLTRFHQRFPGIDFRTESSTHIVNLALDPCDAALRIGGSASPAERSIEVGKLFATPVCSPRLAREIDGFDDLFKHPLIELRSQEARGWRALNKNVRREQIIVLDTYLECVRAVEQGVGVGYAIFPLTTEWVENGRLAIPVQMQIPIRDGLRWVYRAEKHSELLEQVGLWLKAQYAELPGLPFYVDG